MSRLAVILFIAIQVFIFHPSVVAQNKADSLADEVQRKINNTFRYFTFGFYIDSYINITLDNKRDTSNVIPFSSNCPVRDQIRMN